MSRGNVAKRMGRATGVKLGTALCVLCLWGGPQASPLHAQRRPDVVLRIDAPQDQGCSSGASLQQAIETRVGSLIFLDDPEPERRIQVRIAKDARNSTWSAAIVMRDNQGEILGERSVTDQAGTCADLDEALIVVITTLLGIADETAAHPKRIEAPKEPASVAPKEPPAPPARTHVLKQPMTTKAPPANRASGVALVASLGGGVELGLLPGLAPTATLGIALDFDGWAARFGASAWPYAAEDLGLGASAAFLGGALDARLCFDAARPLQLRFALCGGAEVGALSVRSEGLSPRIDRLQALVRGVLGPRLSVPLHGDFGLFLSFDLTVPLAFPRYYFINESGERRYYHEVGPGFRSAIGVDWRFLS